MSSKNKKLIVLLGPTASGKTELAIPLAKKYNGEIISADSMQVYRGMNIGTSKPTKVQQREARHHLIDIVKPDHLFTLAEWQPRAFKAINTCSRKKKIPFLVGGTGLYLSSIIENYRIPKTKPHAELREKLNMCSKEVLLQKLKKLDPHTAKIIDPSNTRRLVRALEHVLIQKTSFAEAGKKEASPYDILIIGIKFDRQQLYKRIDKRVIAMIRRGLRWEVNRLSSEYGWHLPSMQAIGYKEWKPYFDHRADQSGIIRKIQQNSHKYAKRQMTWFRGMEKKHLIHWVVDQRLAEIAIRKFLTK